MARDLEMNTKRYKENEAQQLKNRKENEKAKCKKISGNEINVKTLPRGTKFTTLDGVEREPQPVIRRLGYHHTRSIRTMPYEKRTKVCCKRPWKKITEQH